jgi:small-conductance mechanosensitive channel
MSRRLLRRLSARVEADKRPLIELAGETLFYVVIAGVLILLYQPFGYGDKITVAGNSGTVIGINFRYTVLGAYGGTVVHVPNSTMFSNSVTVEPKTGEAP